MRRLTNYRSDTLIVAGFLLLPLLLFSEVSLGDRTMLPVDNLFQWQPWAGDAADLGVQVPQNGLITDLIVENYAWKRFVRTSLQAGELPLWNPYLFAGAPFLANGQHGAYYPFGILFLIIPLAKAYGLFTVTQLWLAGVLMYVFGRTLRMGRASSALAGLIYQGCGFLVVSAAVFPMILGAAIWLPLLLASIEKVSRRASSEEQEKAGTVLPWAAAGAVALGMQILAGHIEITYYTLLISAIYALWRLAAVAFRRHSISFIARPLFWLAGIIGVGMLLGAIQLIPFYEVGQVNFREDSATFEEVRGFAFPWRRGVTFVLPNFFGNPAHHEYVDAFSGDAVELERNYFGALNPHGAYSSDWGIKNYVEGGVYLGVLSLMLAALGVYSYRHPSFDKDRRIFILFFSALSLLSLLFVFGSPLYAVVYYGLPFADQLNTPFRWVFPLSLCVATLAGFGADYLAETRTWKRYSDWQLAKRSRVSDQDKRNVRASDRTAPGWTRPFLLWGRPSLINFLAGSSFYGGLVMMAVLLSSRQWFGFFEPSVERFFMALAQATDAFPSARAFYSYEFRQLLWLSLMLLASGAVVRVSRCPIFFRRQPIWLFMAAATILLDLFLANRGFNAAVDPALLAHKPELVQWLEDQPGLWRLTSFSPHGDKTFNANSGWLFDLQDIRGYDSIISKQYTQYMEAIEPQNELPFNRVQPINNWESLNSPLLDVLGAKYIITVEEIDLPKLSLAWQGEDVRVYENLAAAPRAYTLPQSATNVVDDALTAMTQFDPRQYAVVDRRDLGRALTAFDTLTATAADYQIADVESYSNIEVSVSSSVTSPSWLILNDSYFPGWKAFLRPFGAAEEQEQETAIVRVNGNFRGVMLEPGHWSVRFRYSPRSFLLGGLASFMGGIILLFAATVFAWRRLVNPNVSLSSTRSIAKNSLAPVLLNLFNRSIDFVFAAYYLRVLGPAAAGSYATAITTAAIFEIISNYGLDLLLMREVSQDKSKSAHYLLNTSILRLMAAAVASLPIILLILGTGFVSNPMSGPEIAAVGLIMAGMLFSGISKGVDRLFYVYEKAEIPAAMTTVTTILKVALGVGALLLGFGFVGLAAVSILTNVVTLVALSVLASRSFQLRGPWRIDWGLQRQMTRQGYPLMLIHLLQTAFISVDVFLLRFMLDNGEEVVGWYNSAYKWFNALQIVPSFFTLALFPIISREIKRALASARRMYVLSLKLMFLLALPIAAVTSFLAYPLVELLAGDEFLPHGAIALQIVIWSIPIGWLNSVTNYVLIGLGLERKQPRAFAIAVCFNILANLFFIRQFSYVAASVTTVLSELVLLIVFDYYSRQRMQGIQWASFLARPLLVTAAMVVAMFLGGLLHPLVGLLLGLIAYPTGLWLARAFGEDERRILRQILPTPILRRLRLGP
jgi:O-antigen/teichoic acid export membrane protein